jgi:hypothetical protein
MLVKEGKRSTHEASGEERSEGEREREREIHSDRSMQEREREERGVETKAAPRRRVYSTVTDLARLRGKLERTERRYGKSARCTQAKASKPASKTKQGKKRSERRDVLDVDAVHDGKVVGQQLEGDDVDEALKAVDGVGHSDESVVGIERVVVVVADNDGLTLSGLDLLEGRLDLGVKTVLGHDQDDAASDKPNQRVESS